MNFGDELINYMNILNCTAKDICKVSKLSPSLISRYLNKKREPKEYSIYLEKIIDALYQIALNKNINLTRNDISKKLTQTLSPTQINYDTFIDNYTLLQDKLTISTVDLSKALGYDSSFLSRIKSKERRPADYENYIDRFTDYVIYVCQNEEKKSILKTTINCSDTVLQDTNELKDILIKWLTTSQSNDMNYISSFITKLDSFKLSDYINTDFSKVKVPTTPVILKSSKSFFGIDGRKKAEGEFLKTTLLSKSKEPIFLYSNLPVAEAGKDENFTKKVVLATTMLLKKGLHLNTIHTLDRPLNEMFLGIENWLPIYMTGSISPYYFTEPPSNFFQNSYWCSGSVALISECLKTNENTSMFYLTTKKDEVAYAQKISKYMLSKAKPLMKIYKETDKEEFEKLLNDLNPQKMQHIEKKEFKNIDFCICDNNWVIINKKLSPEIHFVIYHEKLCTAIKSFILG